MTNRNVTKEISSQQKPYIKNLNRFCCIAPKSNQNTEKELNDIASAHASICNNKLITFPSTSLETVSALESVNTSSNYFEKIKAVSKDWSEQDCFKDALLQIKDDDQCFFITDLPIEWLQKDGIPLSYLNDVCKLPYADRSFHEMYFNDLRGKHYSISKNILDQTLVLMCSPNDPDLDSVYDKEIEKFTEIGFKNYKKCHSKDEFKSEICTKRPDILIIDTHGNYCDTGEESSSFIFVGDETIDSQDIGKLTSMPKIVFLSACNTRPVKHIDDCIVDAFIKNGALAATASYVKLNAVQELLTIVRFINNLKEASNSNCHPNWLSFISHLERTFYAQTLKLNFGINEYAKDSKTLLEEINCLKAKTNAENELALFACVKDKIKPTTDRLELLSLEQSLVGGSYTARKYFYSQWISRCLVSQGLTYGTFYPELFYFTNYGRMDLIPFDIANPQQETFNKTVLKNFGRVKEMAVIEQQQHLIQKYISSKKHFKRNPFEKKVGRNELCPCGSGLKYKKCHGK